ncbi:MAG: hypothetical protein ABIN25_11890 [Ginsengibacter sp.]
MIKYSELKQGDYVLAESDGQAWQGEVTGFNSDEKEVSIYNGVQDFYFKADDLYPIPLDENQLMKLKFHKEINENGSVKYSKGPFRLQCSAQDNFTKFEIWHRNEKRIMLHPISVHELQNHYYSITKVHLTDDLM